MAKAAAPAEPKPKKTFVARGKFVAGDRVQHIQARVSATRTYRPGIGTVIDVEPPFDGWEVMTVKWDDGDPAPVKYWPAELEAAPKAGKPKENKPVEGLAQDMEELGKAEKASIIEDLEQYDD